MKLSFSVSSKPSSHLKKPPTQIFASDEPSAASAKKEYLEEFDSSKPPPSDYPSKTHVIPPKANEWQPLKRMKNLDLPQSDGGDQPLQFEVDTGSSIEPTSNSVSYGLNLRQSTGNADDNPESRSLNPNLPAPDPMLRRLKEDLQRLPDDNGFDEFKDVPVEGFGAALLAGYGWVEGRGIGRNAKEDVKVVEYTRRAGREGLGFTGELPKFANYSRKDEKSENGNGFIKSDREEERRGIEVGKEVRVVGGTEMGRKGRILEVKSGEELVILRLSGSREKVSVDIKNVADLGSVEEERCMRKLKELRIREGDSSGNMKRDKDGDKASPYVQSRKDTRDVEVRERKKESKDSEKRDRRNESKRVQDGSDSRRGSIPWLTSHIRVRIVSKDLKGGKLYLKKGEVVDVVGPTVCDVSMDQSRELIQGVNQEQLETALPKRGGPVLVLYGKHKGVYGNLVERNTEREVAVVRDADTHELINVRLEQIAEYMGDPSYIGY